MPRVELAESANEDLIAIWQHVSADNESAADSLLRRLDTTFRLLAERPQLGEQQKHIRPDLRRFVVGNYLVFFEPMDDGVRIARILHGARRWEDLLS